MTFDRAETDRALEYGEFLPYFQPLIKLRTGQLSGFEVLARWQHSTLGIIPPNDFIPLAERDGWIGALTQQILQSAFTTALTLPNSLQLSVNISPVQLRDPSLAKQIEALSQVTGFPLNRVTIEITESALADNLEQARRIGEELKCLGCKLSLDDFGTGYSSMCHLQSLPFDELKVDRSFVSSMVQKRENRKIVAAVVGLGQSLGLATVAEGIETAEQAEMLMWLGCGIGQGWLFGKAGPAASLASVIATPWNSVSTGIAFKWKNLSIGNMEGLPAQKLAQLQAIYDGAPVGLGFLDRDLRYVNLNRQLARMGGGTVEEHLGRTVQEVIPHLFPIVEPYLRRALQGEPITGIEVTSQAKEGVGETSALVTYQPAFDEAGEVVGVSIAVLDFTARKRAEDQLQRYERVVEGLEEMIVVVDRDYRYVLANRAFLDNRATTRELLLGTLVSDFLDKRVFETVVKEKLDECFRGKVVKYELKISFPVLGERDLLVTYIPIEVLGVVTGAAVVLHDLTELKRMAQVNLDWQKRIDLAQEAGLGIGQWDWDLRADTVDWSGETYHHWGYSKATYSGRVEDLTSRIHPEDLHRAQKAIQEVLAGRTNHYACQHRILHPDGSSCWVEAHGVIVRDPSPHMFGITLDISDLKKAENSLHESEEKYLLLLNSTGEGIYGIDMNGDCTFCNPTCLRLLGYSKSEDLLGKNMHAFVHHSYADGSPYPIEDCKIYVAIRESAGSHVEDEVMWHRDGTSFYAEYWSYPMFKAGEVVGGVITFHDITGRVRAEQATLGSGCPASQGPRSSAM